MGGNSAEVGKFFFWTDSTHYPLTHVTSLRPPYPFINHSVIEKVIRFYYKSYYKLRMMRFFFLSQKLLRSRSLKIFPEKLY